MNIKDKINAFVNLGEFLKDLYPENNTISINETLSQSKNSINNIIKNSVKENPWFIEGNVRFAIDSIAESLNEENILKWIEPYEEKINDRKRNLNVGVVMAGNIPIVGFHDFITVLLSGNRFIGKLSSYDSKLLPAIAQVLIEIEPRFKSEIHFSKDKLRDFEAVIATGSDNTSRYFEYYFGNYPNIIRKNRNGVAVLSGKETTEDLEKLGLDIFMYFGLGCRNVSRLFVPGNYDFDPFFKAIEKYNYVSNHSKYNNNYDFYKSVYLINKEEHLDNGFLILKEDNGYSSPISVLFFEKYNSKKDILNIIKANDNKIQCLLARDNEIPAAIAFGKSQFPELWDYADGIDTMSFLLDI